MEIQYADFTHFTLYFSTMMTDNALIAKLVSHPFLYGQFNTNFCGFYLFNPEEGRLLTFPKIPKLVDNVWIDGIFDTLLIIIHGHIILNSYLLEMAKQSRTQRHIYFINEDVYWSK